MKLFVIADIHGALKPFDRGKDSIAQCDAIVVAGDLCRRGRAEDGARIIRRMEDTGKRIIAVHGNWDPLPVIEMMRDKGYGVHRSSVLMDRIAFFGCGGAQKSLLRTTTMYGEDEIALFLEEAARGTEGAAARILLTHVPPRGMLDRNFFRMRLGSAAVRSFVDRHRPDIVISGHVHEAAGVVRFGNVTMVNPGSFRAGKYCIINIDRDISVEQGMV